MSGKCVTWQILNESVSQRLSCVNNIKMYGSVPWPVHDKNTMNETMQRNKESNLPKLEAWGEIKQLQGSPVVDGKYSVVRMLVSALLSLNRETVKVFFIYEPQSSVFVFLTVVRLKRH